MHLIYIADNGDIKADARIQLQINASADVTLRTPTMTGRGFESSSALRYNLPHRQ